MSRNEGQTLKDGSTKFTSLVNSIVSGKPKLFLPRGKVLDSVNLEIKKGEVVALVGASGSGKTTLSNLLIRFDDPSDGSVKIDGVDLRDLSISTWRSNLGVVTQDANI